MTWLAEHGIGLSVGAEPYEIVPIVPAAVLFDLKPGFVMAHFLLSIVLLTNALVLVRRAGQPDAPAQPVVCRLTHADGTSETILLDHSFSARQLGWFRAGSALNCLTTSP